MTRRTLLACFLTILFLAPAAAQEQAAAEDFRSPSEKAAVGYVRTVLYAQRLYRKKHTKYAPSLHALVGSGSFTRRMTRTDRGDYTVQFSGGGGGFRVALTPKTFDAEHRAFYGDDSGTVRVEENQPATRQSPPFKP